MQARRSHPLDVYLLGLTGFEDALRLQRRLVYEVGESDRSYLLLCEHMPLISVGRSGSRSHIQADDDELRTMGLVGRWVNRGGGCVLHLPGQLAAYFALPLEPMGLNVQDLIDRLHASIIDLLAEFDLKGRRVPGFPGIFLGKDRVASVGVAVNRWIAYHGFTLNVGTYLAPFGLLEEPGPFADRLGQTSMEAIRQRPAPMSKVREALIRSVETHFDLEHENLFTEHPSIGRKVLPHVVVASTRS